MCNECKTFIIAQRRGKLTKQISLPLPYTNLVMIVDIEFRFDNSNKNVF